jgi:hypothetical protein
MRRIAILAVAIANPVFAAENPTYGRDGAKGAWPRYAQYIGIKGYDCPKIVEWSDKGQDHIGSVSKIWCGKTNNRGERIEFRLVLGPGTATVRPWYAWIDD